jgi:hypothetical protein
MRLPQPVNMPVLLIDVENRVDMRVANDHAAHCIFHSPTRFPLTSRKNPCAYFPFVSSNAFPQLRLFANFRNTSAMSEGSLMESLPSVIVSVKFFIGCLSYLV